MPEMGAAYVKPSFLQNIKRYKLLYLLVLPALVCVFLFCYLPMVGVVIAFQDFDIIDGIFGSPWVGVDNFIELFTMPKFGKAILNTLIYSATLLFLTAPLPIFLAICFNEIGNRVFKRVAQTITYLPYFLSWIAVISMTYGMLESYGPINNFLAVVLGEGFERKNILMDSQYFLPILFVTHVWKNLGWNSVIFLAAISGIDPTLYEAAEVDGCGKLRQVFQITIPSIAPTIVIVMVMSMGTLVSSNFEQVYGLQNLYIQEDTEVINTLVYRSGIQNAQYSISTALGLAQGLVSFLLVIVSNKLAKKFAGVGIW